MTVPGKAVSKKRGKEEKPPLYKKSCQDKRSSNQCSIKVPASGGSLCVLVHVKGPELFQISEVHPGSKAKEDITNVKNRFSKQPLRVEVIEFLRTSGCQKTTLAAPFFRAQSQICLYHQPYLNTVGTAKRAPLPDYMHRFSPPLPPRCNCCCDFGLGLALLGYRVGGRKNILLFLIR
eukprot:c19073_g1_i1 orf=556-1086(+)